jgi:hypothetical protein
VQHLPLALSPAHGPYLKDAPFGATRTCLLRPVPPQVVQIVGVQVCALLSHVHPGLGARPPPHAAHWSLAVIRRSVRNPGLTGSGALLAAVREQPRPDDQAVVRAWTTGAK